jgi:HEAT repeat protein
VVPALIRHLTESDATVRRSVVQDLGASGDPRATDALLVLLPRSVQEPPMFAETVRSLAKLGHERAIEPLIRQLEAGDEDLALVLLQGLADLLLQAKSRDVLERATGRMILLFESSEAVSKGDLTINDLVVKNMRPADASAIMEAVRTSLKRLVGIEFTTSAGARKFWNDRDARERFIQIRTSK